MGHLLRWRESVLSIDKLTDIDVPIERKKQFSTIADRVETVSRELKALSESTKGIPSILSLSVSMNIKDWVDKARTTRFL